MQKRTIPKREEKLLGSLKLLNDDWLFYDPFLALVNESYGRAEQWRPYIYYAQLDARIALWQAYSNKHRGIGHKVVRKDGHIILRAQMVWKVYHFRYATVLLQACGDKLANLVREALNITEWSYENEDGQKQLKEANEFTTTLGTLRTHLRLEEPQLRALFIIVKKYLTNNSVNRIIDLANRFKHRLTPRYEELGLMPSRDDIQTERDEFGRTTKISVGLPSSKTGRDLEKDIGHGVETNNLFVQLATDIYEYLDFDEYYDIDEAGNKRLKLF
jgi:hypothetical protein